MRRTARTAYQLQLRIVRDGGRVPTHARGVAGDEWQMGSLLTKTDQGRYAALDGPIDANAAGPIAAICTDHEGFSGDAAAHVNVQEIGVDTVFEAQVLAGAADRDDVFKRCRLTQDATTGHYAVDLNNTTDPSIEIVSVEPEFHGNYGPGASANYNLVWFKFVPGLIATAPAEVS